jgi:glycosyltransferase involved in cell wall biosynthesis
VRVVIVDLLCYTPFYCGPLVESLRDSGVEAELASPEFYLEPGVLRRYRRSPWIVDVAIHAGRPYIVRLAARSFELLCNWWRLERAVKSGDYDVVHVQWIPMQGKQTVFMSRLKASCNRAGVALVLTVHNVLPHDCPTENREVISKNVNLADLVIVHTQHVEDSLRRDIGVRSEVAVIPHGPLFTDFSLPAQEEARERLGIGIGGGPVILFQGGRSYKGLDLLIEAWPRVLAAHPTAELSVIGRSETADARSQLAGIENMQGVHVTEHYVSTETLLDHFAACDIAAFPYKAISQSGALMTAVGLGKATVVTPLPGLIEQVTGLGSATVAEEVSGPAVAAALCAALDRREELARKAVQDRRQVMESPAGWSSVARRTIDAYVRSRGHLDRSSSASDHPVRSLS